MAAETLHLNGVTGRHAGSNGDALSLRRFFLPTLSVLVYAGLLVAYLHCYAFRTGLDATSSSYRAYWYPLLAFEAVVVAPALMGWLVYLARSRCIDCVHQSATGSGIEPTHEMRHLWTHLSILLAGNAAGLLTPVLFAVHDAAWHQATLRDSSLSPTHIPLFFGSASVTLVLIVGAFVYGRTRLQNVWAKDASVPLAYRLTIGAWVVILFFFALNEFGHIEWITEERLTNLVHWPGALPLASQLAMLAVMLRDLSRMGELFSQDRGFSLARRVR